MNFGLGYLSRYSDSLQSGQSGQSGDRILVRGEIFRTRQDRPWVTPRLLFNGYWIFPGDKVRPGRAADHSPPSSVAVVEE